jgi:methylaspartate ammonia-lyase
MAKKNTKSAKSVEPAEVQVIAKPGMGIDEGVVMLTFAVLAFAVWLVVAANKGYGA